MMFADAQHTSTGRAAGPSVPKVLWTYQLPFSYGIAVATDAATGDDVVYATTDGDPAPNGGFHAITSTGKPAWQWVCPDGGYMDCSPSVGSVQEGRAIYVGETNAHAVAPNSTLLWDVALNAAGPYASSSVLGPDGTVFFGTGSFSLQCYAYAIFPNGTVRWSISQGILPANVHVPPAVSADGSVVYFNWANQLHALSAADGTQLWAADVGGECAPSLGPDGTVYCGSSAFAGANGTRLWSVPLGSPHSCAYVAAPAGASDSGRLYGIGGDGAIYALSRATGAVKWSVHTGGGGAAGCVNATAFVLDAAGSLFVRDSAGRVLSLSRSTGAVRWNLTLPGEGAAAPTSSLPWQAGFAMMSDGTLLFGAWNSTSTVYAIGEKGKGVEGSEIP